MYASVKADLLLCNHYYPLSAVDYSGVPPKAQRVQTETRLRYGNGQIVFYMRLPATVSTFAICYASSKSKDQVFQWQIGVKPWDDSCN